MTMYSWMDSRTAMNVWTNKTSRAGAVVCLLLGSALMLTSAAAASEDVPPVGDRNHWSLQTVVKPELPKVQDTTWSDHPIDRFILARLEEHNLAPNPPADRLVLVRRALFDLTGLPPTAEQIDTFLSDSSENAYERLIERALASRHYGERWGRHWLDVARYSDTAGDSSDYPIPQAYLYRNWVIDSFNEDMPFDQFVRMQIAGDLIGKDKPAEQYADHVIATTFIANARRFGGTKKESPELIIENTLDTIGRGLMGMTLRCARCHDHKFDPISANEYYGLYGIFESTRYPHPGAEHGKEPYDLVPMYNQSQIEELQSDYREELERLNAEFEKVKNESEQARLVNDLEEQVRQAMKARADASDAGQDTSELDTRVAERTEALNAAKVALKEACDKVKEKIEAHKRSEKPEPPLVYGVMDENPRDAQFQKNGNRHNTGDSIPRGFPVAISYKDEPTIQNGESGRRELAQWLTSPKHPLTARVIVNRIWLYHFGKGLVRTPDDFGTTGSPPTHPQLLDYLAATMIEKNWSIKEMHRLIMTSRTYQMSSANSAGNQQTDPDNNWYWRFDRQRLGADALRDAVLFVADTLNDEMPGAHPFPPKEKWNYTQHNQFEHDYPTLHRSVYQLVRRLRKTEIHELFDGPDANECTGMRRETTVPSQALFMMNSPFIHSHSQSFARRVMREAENDEQRVRLAHKMAFGTEISKETVDTAIQYVQEQMAKMDKGSEQDKAVRAWASYCRVLLMSNEFVFID